MPTPMPDVNVAIATETATTKVLVRLAAVVLPLMVTVIGWLVVQSNTRTETALAEQGETLIQIKSDVRDTNTRMDERVIRAVDQHSKQIDALTDRVIILERAVATP